MSFRFISQFHISSTFVTFHILIHSKHSTPVSFKFQSNFSRIKDIFCINVGRKL